MDRRKVLHWRKGPAALVTCVLAPARVCAFFGSDCLLVPGVTNGEGIHRVPRSQRSPEFCRVPLSIPSGVINVDAVVTYGTIRFVGVSVFHTIVLDPLIGGNTIILQVRRVHEKTAELGRLNP